MALLDIDNQPLDFPCGKCGHKSSVTLRRLKSDPKIVCSKCNQVTDVDIRPIVADLKKLEADIAKITFK